MITSNTLHRLFLHFGNSSCYFSPNIEEASIILRFLGCLWFLMNFVVCSTSLILSLFLSSFRFFIISENSPG